MFDPFHSAPTDCYPQSFAGASKLSSIPNLLPALVKAGDKLAGLEIAGRWVDVRDPEVLAELEREQAGS